MQSISYTSLRKNLSSVLDDVENNREVYYVTRKQHEDVVVLSRKDYDSITETLYLLSSSNNRKVLLSAIKGSGKGKKVSLKSKKDIDKFLAI